MLFSKELWSPIGSRLDRGPKKGRSIVWSKVKLGSFEEREGQNFLRRVARERNIVNIEKR